MTYHKNARRVEAAGDLTATLLGVRRSLPQQASDPYASQVQRDIARDRVRPLAMIVAVLACAIRDGAPEADVAEFPRRLGDWVSAQYPATSPRPLSLLHLEETAADGELDAAQLRAVIERTPSAVEECLTRLDAYLDVADELRGALVRARYSAA